MFSIVRVLSGEPISPPPFWFMRQAGRYLPEYREVRKKAGGFLNLCYTPALAAEVTLQPIRRFSMSAAIIFSDILVVPHALGQKVWFEEGEGPRLGPLEIKTLSQNNFHQHLAPVYEALKLTRKQLPAETALIGFAGSPWTLACYMVQGKASRDFEEARKKAIEQPEFFHQLIELLTHSIIEYLSCKIESGANVVQLFDSWAGVLSAEEFRKWVIQPTQNIVQGLKKKHPQIPIIGFPRGAGLMAAEYAQQTGVDGISVDYSVPIEWAAQHIPCAIQGNLDPLLLLADEKTMLAQAKKICDAMRGKKFIFNLGHGINKETPIAHVEVLSQFLRSYV